MPVQHITFARDKNRRAHRRRNILGEAFSTRRRRFGVAWVGAMLLVLCGFTYRRVFHPDIRNKVALFVQASSQHDLDKLYAEFNDAYRGKVSLSQHRAFLLTLYKRLPTDLNFEILQIYHVDYQDGGESYDVRLKISSPHLEGEKTFITVSFVPSKERGWTLDALPTYQALFARLYGEKSADYVSATWHDYSNAKF